jgi:uroporphyrinogen-III synthase
MNIYISRKKEQAAFLMRELEALGHRVEAIPMIRTEAVEMPSRLPDCEWIFFSSAEAVRFFFEQRHAVSGKKWAALGASTAAALKQYVTVDFTGDASDIEGTAKTFASISSGQMALFPVSEQSLRSIQQHKKREEVADVVCYRTIPQPKKIADADILVFSSPSNVDAFFQVNEKRANSRFVAFGPSTAAALQKQGISDPVIPVSLEDSELLRTIKSLTSC